MITIKRHLIIEQGTTFSNTFQIFDDNNELLITTGYSANAKMREYHNSTNSVSFTPTLSNGQITISLTANQTANLVPTRYVYDINLTDSSNNINRFMEGYLQVTPSVTR